MATIRSVSHGDANTIPKDLPEDYFPPDFMEYMLMEQLNWSRHKNEDYSGVSYSKWVFWSQQDHSLDNCAHFNPNVPKVRDNIRLALHKLTESPGLPMCSLVQFWAATTTLEGRTKLTTQYQPFALALTFDTTERQQLCEYRMKMCRDYNFFYADTESGEEQLGLPGRVFLHKSPESSPNVKYYSTKEYPQRDLALLCRIHASWALPVFEHSSQTCVGVLEMVSLFNTYWCDKFFLRMLRNIFQELGLQSFDGFHACVDEGKSVGLPQAFEELKAVLRLVCEIHELPLAMTWVPCSACNGLQQREVSSENVLRRDLDDFVKAAKCSNLRKGLVAERARSSPNLLYCSDITQLSLDEYPLVHYARMCNLSGWFTICLQCKRTGNYIYVLEFFLSARGKDDEKILTTLSFILGTIEEKFTTFRLASGKELGEKMSVEVIYFKNGQKFHLVQSIQATRNFSNRSSDFSMQSSASVANTIPVTIANTRPVTINAKYDLNSDPLRKFSSLSIDIFSSLSIDMSSAQSSASVTNKWAGFQDANLVTIKTTYDPNSDLLRNFFGRGSYMSSVQSSASVANKRPGFQDANMSSVQSSASVANTRPGFQDANMSSVQSSASVANTRPGFQDANMSSVQSSASVANTRPGFQDANMLTIKAEDDLNSDTFFDSDMFSDSEMFFDFDPSFEQSITGVANTRPRFQDTKVVTIEAKYASIAIVLKLSLPCRLVELHQEVAKSLKLEAETYHVVYKDEDDGSVLIACDEDLQTYVDDSISQGNTSPVVLLEPKDPAIKLNPTI